VPAGVTTIHVVAQGGQGALGGSSTGGLGAEVSGDLTVTAGDTLYVEVGGSGSGGGVGGYNGGGSSSGGGGGGGASDVRTKPASDSGTLDSRLLVAAGAGGGGGAVGTNACPGGNGGDAGSAGGPGTDCAVPPGGGGGAGSDTQGGTGGTSPRIHGANGGKGAGGDGAESGGGGGGGLFGGGGGGAGADIELCDESGCFTTESGGAGGGGGGSNLVPDGGSAALSSDAPFVSITYSGACMETGFYRDGNNLTAKQIGGNVTGTLDASECNIGAYFDATHPGSVSGANISGANYYGVVDNAASVNISNSSIHDIGETQPNGSQHGLGVIYTTLNGTASCNACITSGPHATGTLSGSTITNYQKGGIVITGSGAAVTMHDNTVTGYGMIDYIAQNGIQVSFGATARLFANTVTLNNYTPPKVTACGLLLYKAGGVSGRTKTGLSFIIADNTIQNNETNTCNFGKGGGFSPTP
jgi:hypothetical protein